MSAMPRPRYPYTQREVSRHGKTTWYFRIGDGKRTRLPGEYGSEEFVAAWTALMAGQTPEAKPEANRHTLAWLVTKYEQSAAFKSLRPSTQRSRTNMFKVVCKTGGNLPISKIDRATIAAGRDRRADTPFAAINFMKMMGYLFEWAVDAGYATENPVRGVKRPKVKTNGHAPWTEEDVIAFYKQHPAGSEARLAMELILFTGLRRSDVYLLGPQHVRNEVIEFRATKNSQELFIPLHPILRQTLAGVQSGHMAFLVTPVHGRPFKSAAAFGNWFGDVCKEAGVSGRAHGIRKSVAQKLAESGGSNAELKALFGWNSDAMASLYTKNADRRKMAATAGEKLNRNSLSPHLENGAGLTPISDEISDT